MEYSREALKSQLQLTAKQLNILATIAGNNIIPYEDVKHFHKTLNTRVDNHFFKLADYVRQFPLELIPLEEIIKKISNEIYGSEEDIFIKRLTESNNMYNITPYAEFDKPQETDLILLSKSTQNRFLYSILTGLPINLVLRYMDLRRTDFMPFLDLVKPILRRAIGVIRSHIETDANYMQVVRAKVQHHEPYTDFMIAPEYPKHIGKCTLLNFPFFLVKNCVCSAEIPKDLIFGNDENDQRHYQLRLDIIKWISFGEDSIQLNVEEIPRGYMVTVLVLKYLLNVEYKFLNFRLLDLLTQNFSTNK